jgi:hypothetical protein
MCKHPTLSEDSHTCIVVNLVNKNGKYCPMHYLVYFGVSSYFYNKMKFTIKAVLFFYKWNLMEYKYYTLASCYLKSYPFQILL